MTDNVEETEETEDGHGHAWSLLKDRDFAEITMDVLSYMAAAHGAAPCHHTDHPVVEAMESVGRSYSTGSPLPDHAPLVAIVTNLIQRAATDAFWAGIQFQRDGKKLDGFREFKADVMDFEGDELENFLPGLAQSRQMTRDEHYMPDNENAKMAAFLKSLGVDKNSNVVVMTPEQAKKFGLAKENPESAPQTGLYL